MGNTKNSDIHSIIVGALMFALSCIRTGLQGPNDWFEIVFEVGCDIMFGIASLLSILFFSEWIKQNANFYNLFLPIMLAMLTLSFIIMFIALANKIIAWKIVCLVLVVLLIGATIACLVKISKLDTHTSAGSVH